VTIVLQPLIEVNPGEPAPQRSPIICTCTIVNTIDTQPLR